MQGFGIISNKLKEMYQVRSDPIFRLWICSILVAYEMQSADDHSWWKCRARTVRFGRSFLGGYLVFGHATKEELEEHLESVWRRENVVISCPRLCSPCLQGTDIVPIHVQGHILMTLPSTWQPTPLYFMDEIDAALDFRNVSIVANYIKDRTKNAQFIIISLRNVSRFPFFRIADRFEKLNDSCWISTEHVRIVCSIDRDLQSR